VPLIKYTTDDEIKYEKEYSIINNPTGSKLIVTPEKEQIKEMLKLFEANKNHKYTIIYFLLSSGKYQSANPLTWNELEIFCEKYTDYLESDARHNFGVMDNDTKDTVVYDHHNILYVYGNVKKKIEMLEKNGYKKVEKINIPQAHGHLFHSENDDIEKELIKNNKWIITLIKDRDKEFNHDDEDEAEERLNNRVFLPKWIIEDGKFDVNDCIRRFDNLDL
jgi:hypothetical protein